MQVIADLHGGDPDNSEALEEFREIKDRVIAEVSLWKFVFSRSLELMTHVKRETGEARSYAVMWKKYKRRVLLAMSSQAFAQLVRYITYPFYSCTN